MITMRKIIWTSFILLYPFVSIAQQKYEREYRINSETIPKSATDFIDSISLNSKIKWYREISLDEVTIEAKFSHNKKKFSVEFDTLGKLLDVEIVLNKRELNAKVQNRINNELDSVYKKWKFQKIQLNYSGKGSHILAAIKQNEPSDSIKIAYEIVIKGKDLEGTYLYEITFNDQGELQNILEIIPDKADHLEY